MESSSVMRCFSFFFFKSVFRIYFFFFSLDFRNRRGKQTRAFRARHSLAGSSSEITPADTSRSRAETLAGNMPADEGGNGKAENGGAAASIIDDERHAKHFNGASAATPSLPDASLARATARNSAGVAGAGKDEANQHQKQRRSMELDDDDDVEEEEGALPSNPSTSAAGLPPPPPPPVGSGNGFKFRRGCRWNQSI